MNSKTNEDITTMQEYTEITGKTGTVNEKAVREKYALLTNTLIEKNLTITTMESCTSGQIASLIADTEGSSAIIKGACITYSNEAKVKEGVMQATIDDFGVYSPETAAAMAITCKEKYDADIGIGVTGSFGNADPNNSDSIPGEVWFAIATEESTKCFHCTIPNQNSRLNYKLYMADVLADQLL